MNIEGVKKLLSRRAFRELSLGLMLSFALIACGGGKNKKVSNEGDVSIDQLLGIESEQPKQGKESEKKPEKDEVLRLLGISPEGQKSTEQAKESGSGLDSLRIEVQRLETELNQKDQTIQDLRRDLEQKDKKLEELQAQTTSIRSTQSSSLAGFTPAAGSFRERYQAALALYRSRKYHEAINAFSALLAENANNSLSDNCQYWIGESYYGLGNYSQAIAEFEKVFAYPKSNKSDAALLKLGITYLKLGDRESARAQFEQLIATYPKSEYLEMARRYLNQLQ